MQILGIESASLVASVAIFKEDNILAEYTLNYQKTHSQTLLPMLDEIVSMTGIDLNDVDAIAISNGPGSFTGLRIGSATAKGLGCALNKPVIEVPTVTAMAFGMFGFDGIICPIMDARRNQVYTGLYRFSANIPSALSEQQLVIENMCFETIMPPSAVSVDELVEKVNALNDKVCFLGDGVPVYRAQIESKMSKTKPVFVPPFAARQRAGVVATLANVYYKNGLHIEDAAKSAPDYLRKSSAERELEEKNAKKGEL